jgi:hypothetical protein
LCPLPWQAQALKLIASIEKPAVIAKIRAHRQQTAPAELQYDRLMGGRTVLLVASITFKARAAGGDSANASDAASTFTGVLAPARIGRRGRPAARGRIGCGSEGEHTGGSPSHARFVRDFEASPEPLAAVDDRDAVSRGAWPPPSGRP